MNNTMFISNAITGDTEINLVPNKAIKTLDNTGCYHLIICCNAVANANLPVTIQVQGVNIPVLCKAGNTVYANQLQKRRNYTIMYGDENAGYVNGQFVIQDRICPRANQIPATTATDTTSTSEDTTNNSTGSKGK